MQLVNHPESQFYINAYGTLKGKSKTFFFFFLITSKVKHSLPAATNWESEWQNLGFFCDVRCKSESLIKPPFSPGRKPGASSQDQRVKSCHILRKLSSEEDHPTGCSPSQGAPSSSHVGGANLASCILVPASAGPISWTPPEYERSGQTPAPAQVSL